MPNAFFYSNTAVQTTLTGSISAGATSIQVAATTGFPGSFPYILALDYGAATEELVSVTAAAGTTLTVTRGYGGTSAQSHSLGAVVRHVVNAQDLTDFRTHEASTGAVHGLTGSIVGTSDTQTLSNKTLTSPTINAGALSGTFTGTPTFSGAVLLTGDPVFQRGSATDMALEARVSGDTQSRIKVEAGGRISWGAGGASATDVNLYRLTANVLAVDDQVFVSRSSGTDLAYSSRRAADSGDRLAVTTDGVVQWGDGTGALDTNLYRSAANTLKTDDSLEVAGSLAVTGSLSVTGVGREIIAYKTGNTGRTSTTSRTIDPHLATTLPANQTWIMSGYLKYSAATAGDISLGFDAPGDVALMSWAYHMPDTTVTGDPSTVRIVETSTTGARSYGGITSPVPIAGLIGGTFETGPTGGTFGISWAQAVSDGAATTVYQGSWLRFRRVA